MGGSLFRVTITFFSVSRFIYTKFFKFRKMLVFYLITICYTHKIPKPNYSEAGVSWAMIRIEVASCQSAWHICCTVHFSILFISYFLFIENKVFIVQFIIRINSSCSKQLHYRTSAPKPNITLKTEN